MNGLCIAIISGDNALASQLISDGLDEKYKDGNQNTLLHIACPHSDISVIRALLDDGGIDVNAQNCYGCTALYYACYNNRYDVAKLLVENGACNLENNEHDNPLLWAISDGQTEVIEAILKSKVNNINILDENGNNALYHACYDNRYAIAKMLFDYGIMHVPNNNQYTPLMHAAINGYYDIAALILKNKIDNVNVRDSNGNTALYYAYEKNEY